MSAYENSSCCSPKENTFSCKSLSDPEDSLSIKLSSDTTSYEEDNLRDTSCCDPSVNTTEAVIGIFQTSDFTNLITLLLKSNRVLHQEIQKMQREHQKSMTTLMQVCHKLSDNKIPYSDSAAGWLHDGNSMECGVVGDYGRVGELSAGNEGEMEEKVGQGDKNESTDCLPRKVDSAEDCFPQEYEDQKNQLDYISVESLTYYSRELDKSSCNKERNNATIHSNPESPGIEAVKNMWEHFSVNSHDLTVSEEEPVVKSKQKKWNSKATVPQPFNMSIREAKSHKKKSRSLKIAEQEDLKKKAMDDAEVRKIYCATPIPASTFLPLHELSNARNEQKRNILKKECAKNLESTQKPFSFYKRDTLKQKHREDIHKQNLDQEVAMLKKNMFKAKPVPPNLLDSEMDQKLLEQEEYKAIIKKMRADKLLAKSKLPFHMQKSAVKPDKKHENHEDKDFLTDDQCFHPNVPKCEKGFHTFPQHPVSEKHSKGTTIAEPLQTDSVCSRRTIQDKFQAAEKKIMRKQIKKSQKTLCVEPYTQDESRRRKMEEFR